MYEMKVHGYVQELWYYIRGRFLDFYNKSLLADNLDEFNAYPLGIVLCIETYNSIIKAMSKKVQNLIYGKISNKVYIEDNYSMVDLHLLLW